MKHEIFKNMQSGFFIALLALPLSLGIASASSFPPIAGLISAIVAGIFCSFIAGSPISIKGPAAGLIVIVMAAVYDLGNGDLVAGYKRTLAIGVIAALGQIILAFSKISKVGKVMPPSIIHGMLAAIGVIIMSKQSHILLGNIPSGKTPFELILELPHSIMHANPELLFMGVIVFICMIILPKKDSPLLKKIPPALIALSIVIPLSLIWHLHDKHSYSLFGYNFNVGPEFLVNIPSSLLNSFVFPDFSILKNLIAYKYIIMLMLVGSLESILTVIAIDSLSSNKKESDLDKDLLAIGIGNLISSLLGGLPIISEVVRSKANIDSNASNAWSAFFHGAFLLFAVLFLGNILQEIPLSALAAMLIIVGFKLASPAQFKHVKKIGNDQLLLFSATLLITLATDLLVGVFSGVLLKIFIHIIRGIKLKDFLYLHHNLTEEKNKIVIAISGPLIFSNSLQLYKLITKFLNSNKIILIDLEKAKIVDHTTLQQLQTFTRRYEEMVVITGLNSLKSNTSHHLSTHSAI